MCSTVSACPSPDAVIELWQANAEGKYAHPEDTQDKPLEAGFRGFGRIPTDEQGEFRFTTIKPGSVPGPNDVPQAPHFMVGLLMRGLLKGLTTPRLLRRRPAQRPLTPFSNSCRRPGVRTLMLRPADQPNCFLWEIRMQGPQETCISGLLVNPLSDASNSLHDRLFHSSAPPPPRLASSANAARFRRCSMWKQPWRGWKRPLGIIPRGSSEGHRSMFARLVFSTRMSLRKRPRSVAM